MKFVSEMNQKYGQGSLAGSRAMSGLNTITVVGETVNDEGILDLTNYWRPGVVNTGLTVETSPGVSVVISFTLATPEMAKSADPLISAAVSWVAMASQAQSTQVTYSNNVGRAAKFVFTGPAGSYCTIAIR